MKLNILLVEDDRLIRTILVCLLQKFGHIVYETESIAQARTALASAQFDLIMADQNLDDGDGLEFLNEMVVARPEMQRILMTGNEDPGNHNHHFLRKPFNATQVQTVLTETFQTTPQ